MAIINKNKIHNPQIVSDGIPENISNDDIGRIWNTGNSFKIALTNENKELKIKEMLNDDHLEMIDNKYFKEIKEKICVIESQDENDKHYQKGYDFFNDDIFLKNASQEIQDYYSFYYIEVADSSSPGYIRSVSTSDGVKYVRCAIGGDTYTWEGNDYNVVNYSKIKLDEEIKEVVSIIFDNKDILENGYELSEDKKSILIYAEPDGYFIGKQVKVKYLI
jgi:hypothetical protein